MRFSANSSNRKVLAARRALALVFVSILSIQVLEQPVFASSISDKRPPLDLSGPPPGSTGSVLPLAYAQITGIAVSLYANPADPDLDIPPLKTFQAGYVWVTLADPYPFYAEGGVWYRLNPEGYIRADQIKLYQPSEFQGTLIADQPARAFGWIVVPVRPSSTPGAAPRPEAPLLSRYTPVQVSAEQKVGDWMWYQIWPDQWVEQRRLGLVVPTPRPEGVGAGDKWIDVNLFEQTLAAYEGDRMVYATLVSSGLSQWFTPKGLTRIWAKISQGKMSGREGFPDYYFLPDVPWAMYFNRDVALHGAYWHDRFGAQHSHGCVNLAPRDALWLFNWTTPAPGPGTYTLPNAENPGTWVWVH